ncbi:MAG: prephenate dehydratase [Lachnospiraceae bacterium]|nr:prephenate dehydratase [Lachnospiraceae bacterium]
MKDLLEIRNEIDVIDSDILKDFYKRLLLTNEVAEYKIATGKKVLDRQREEEKLSVLTEDAPDEFQKEGIRELFELIMSISRKKQYSLMAGRGGCPDFGFTATPSLDIEGKRVVYQGVEGAYSQAALVKYFGETTERVNVSTWRDAMEALKNKKADYAVLPIENSTAGAVTEIYDLLNEYDMSIVAQEIIPIEHALLGQKDAKLSEIKRVLSHPQALMQCSEFFDQNPGIEQEKAENTAVAAKTVKDLKDNSVAAIAGEINAGLYDLKILRKSIQNKKNNETRFLILSPEKTYINGTKRMSICFELPNENGSLYKILSHFAFNGLNMTRIESRPLGEENWHYRFFVDFEGDLEDVGTQSALCGLLEETRSLKILGQY